MTEAAQEEIKEPLFVLFAKLAEKDGVTPLHEKVKGCWERQIDENWWIALNGTNKAQTCSTGAEVPPFSAYVTWLGWPSGILNPHGGTLVAHPNANEELFAAALEKAIQ